LLQLFVVGTLYQLTSEFASQFANVGVGTVVGGITHISYIGSQFSII
jgi:hypothetical protein